MRSSVASRRFTKGVRLPVRILWRYLICAVVPFVAACSGSSSPPRPSSGPAQPAGVPSATPFPTQSGDVDDWVTYAHDSARTGFEPQNTGITAANVSQLTLRWKYAFGETVTSSPIVANGFVYLAGGDGTVRALSTADGSVVWQTSLGAQVAMTPLLDSGLLLVATHTPPGTLFALDAASGAVRWTATTPGAIRGEPVVLDGTVYIGDASGDPPTCNQGGVHGFDELSGGSVFTWHDDPKPNDGGGVWNPMSTDGTSLYLGTGNTCSMGVTYANSAVKLSTAGTVEWGHNAANPLSDDDYGSALTLLGSDAVSIDKNGMLYAFDQNSGTIVWSDKLGDLDGYGGISSAASDGQTIVVGAGYIHDPTKTAGNPGGLLYGLTRGGKILWKLQTDTAIPGSAAIVPGLAFVAMNDGISALALGSGSTLWTYPFGADTYASAAVVPSGVYVADGAGNLYAFGLPASASAAARASKSGRR